MDPVQWYLLALLLYEGAVGIFLRRLIWEPLLLLKIAVRLVVLERR